MVHGIKSSIFDETYKTTLKSEKLTTREKKNWKKKSRRSFQFSKRSFFFK